MHVLLNRLLHMVLNRLLDVVLHVWLSVLVGMHPAIVLDHTSLLATIVHWRRIDFGMHWFGLVVWNTSLRSRNVFCLWNRSGQLFNKTLSFAGTDRVDLAS